MARPTILDIAKAAGVSKGAVSYALNGRPGVSAATRARILAVADELGWVPSSAARALSNARAEAVGLIAVRSLELVATEPFFMRTIAGIERALAARGLALLLTVLPDESGEMELYRRWWGSRRVDGFFMLDLRTDDPRPRWVEQSGVPAVVLGEQRVDEPSSGIRSASHDVMRRAVLHLRELGHRRIAMVGGPQRLEHFAARSDLFAEVCRDLLGQEQSQIDADLTAEDGVRASRELLGAGRPPSAILYANDVMAVASVAALTSEGVKIPGDVAVLAWDDSTLCRLVRPEVTAFSLDFMEEGAMAAELLLARIAGEVGERHTLPPAALMVRESTVVPS